MRAILFIIAISIICYGCATYEKRNQLSPQESSGWIKKSSDTYQFQCNQGEVEVNPIVLGYESKGNFDFFVPIPESKKELEQANKDDAWVYIQFRNTKAIEACNLSYVFLENQESGNRVSPVSANNIPANGLYKGKYTHGCHYFFNLNETGNENYSLHISEEVFNCRISPILLKHEKSFEMIPRQLM
mgnify:CR=1 FL=1